MLTVAQVGEYLHVAGYADGSDWWVLLPDHTREIRHGTAGPEHVWYVEGDGRLHLLHAPSRRQRAAVQLEGVREPNVRSMPVHASRDGRRLYILHWLGPGATEGRVHVVDVPAGVVAAVHRGLPALQMAPAVERPDGRLLLPTLRQSLVLLDATTGAWEESRVPGDPGAGNFSSGSPDGRYWIRFDPAALPVHDAAPGFRFLGRLLGENKKPERRYGLTLQIWRRSRCASCAERWRPG